MRYRLSRLLVLVTIVVVLLGFSQHRRRTILRICEEYRQQGFHFDVPSDNRDYIWQRRPVVAWLFNGGLVYHAWAGSCVAAIRSDPPDSEMVRKLRENGMLCE